MFDQFKAKTKEEKKEVLKTAGKVTLGLAGVGALSYIVGRLTGFKDGINWIWEKGLQLNEQKDKEPEEIESTEEGEA